MPLGVQAQPRPHLLLLQADNRAVAAAAPLPLKCRNLFCLDLQDLLLLLVLQLQLLGMCRVRSSVGRAVSGTRILPEPVIPQAQRSAYPAPKTALCSNPQPRHPQVSLGTRKQKQTFARCQSPYIIHPTEFSP